MLSAAGQCFSCAALKGSKLQSVVDTGPDVDVDPIWKSLIMFDPRTEVLQRHLSRIRHKEDEARVPDVDRERVLQFAPRHWQRACVHRVGEGNLVPTEPRLGQGNFNFGAEVFALEHATVAVDAARAGQLDDAARGIAAAFDLAAVAVPDAHAEVGGVARL